MQAQGGKKLATTISLKYDDPGKASRVAQSANKALQSGVKPARIRFIVENAKSAEDALRKINAIRITPKRLEIIEKGGDLAIRMLECIAGRKLTPKEVKIAQRGGVDALGILARINGTLLPPKTQNIKETGGSSVLNWLLKIIGAVLPPKTQQIRESGASGVFGVLGRLASTVLPAITQWIVTKKKGAATGGRGGFGLGEATPGTARLQDRAATRGMQGLLPRASTAQASRGMKVSGPRAIWGEEPQHPEFVIATNPAYRQSNLGYLRSAASALGVDMAAAGSDAEKKKNPAAKPKELKKARKEARANLRGKTTARKNASGIPEINNVTRAQLAEDNFRDVIQREANQLDAREPDTFLKVTGTDPYTGQEMYEVDSDAVSRWSTDLANMAGRFDELVAKIQQTLNAVLAAMKKLGSPDGKGGGIVGRADSNIESIQELITRERGTAKSAKTKAGRQRAQERVEVYQDALERERAARSAAASDYRDMEGEKNAIGDDKRGRMSEAKDAASCYYGDAAAVAGKASADAAASNPEPARPDAPPSALESAQGRVNALESEQALSEIGMSSKTSEQIKSQMIDAHKAVIAQGQADLADSDPSNDSSAYSAISSSAQAIKSLTEVAGDSGPAGPSAANEYMALGSARGDLLRSFGSNFKMAGSFGAMHRATKGIGGGGAFGMNPGAMGQMAAGGGIVFQQTFNQMPDPHTWSQGVAFELQAAL